MDANLLVVASRQVFDRELPVVPRPHGRLHLLGTHVQVRVSSPSWPAEKETHELLGPALLIDITVQSKVVLMTKNGH